MASVVFTEPAEYDLMDIEYYIYVDLSNPHILLLSSKYGYSIYNQNFI